MKGLTDSVGVEEYLKWIIYYHERQEAHVRTLAAFRVAFGGVVELFDVFG